jgi:hypothetical protein
MPPDVLERFRTRDLGGGVTVESFTTQQTQVQAGPAVARLRATSARASWTTAPSTCAGSGFGNGHVSSLGHMPNHLDVTTKPIPAYGHRQPKEMSP